MGSNCYGMGGKRLLAGCYVQNTKHYNSEEQEDSTNMKTYANGLLNISFKVHGHNPCEILEVSAFPTNDSVRNDEWVEIVFLHLIKNVPTHNISVTYRYSGLKQKTADNFVSITTAVLHADTLTHNLFYEHHSTFTSQVVLLVLGNAKTKRFVLSKEPSHPHGNSSFASRPGPGAVRTT